MPHKKQPLTPCSPHWVNELSEHPWATKEQAIKIDCDHVKSEKKKRRR
jgi:hypothetical protein